MRELRKRYSAAQAGLRHRFNEAVTATGVDITREADMLAERFGVLSKRRAASEYSELAGHLLGHYPSEVAYFIAVEIAEQFERPLGYPPIGQIMVGRLKSGEATTRLGGSAAPFGTSPESRPRSSRSASSGPPRCGRSFGRIWLQRTQS